MNAKKLLAALSFSLLASSPLWTEPRVATAIPALRWAAKEILSEV